MQIAYWMVLVQLTAWKRVRYQHLPVINTVVTGITNDDHGLQLLCFRLKVNYFEFPFIGKSYKFITSGLSIIMTFYPKRDPLCQEGSYSEIQFAGQIVCAHQSCSDNRECLTCTFLWLWLSTLAQDDSTCPHDVVQATPGPPDPGPVFHHKDN